MVANAGCPGAHNWLSRSIGLQGQGKTCTYISVASFIFAFLNLTSVSEFTYNTGFQDNSYNIVEASLYIQRSNGSCILTVAQTNARFQVKTGYSKQKAVSPGAQVSFVAVIIEHAGGFINSVKLD